LLWEGRYGYTDKETGKRIVKSIYSSSKAEAKQKLKVLIDQIDNRLIYENADYIKPSNTTLSQWVNIWMKEYKKK
jgi:hypothetical protein